MANLIFDDNFYVNKTSEIDIMTAKKNIELFIGNMHHSKKRNVHILKNKIFPEPVWKAVIFGEYKFSFTSPSSAGFFIINSHYIAYTVNKTAVTVAAVINQFGYVFHEHKVTIEIDRDLNALVIETPKEKVLIGQNSPTLEKDYHVIKNLLENNYKNFHNLNNDQNSQHRNENSYNSKKGKNDMRNKPKNSKNINTVDNKEQNSHNKNADIPLSESKNANTPNETMENLNDKSNNSNKVSKDKKHNKYEAVDSRFKKNRHIISNNYIPEGFIFKEPIVVASVQGPGFSNFTDPSSGYLKVHDKCLNLIIQKIDKGEIDAVFNLKYTVHNVQGNYEIVMFGDGVAFDDKNED